MFNTVDGPALVLCIVIRMGLNLITPVEIVCAALSSTKPTSILTLSYGGGT